MGGLLLLFLYEIEDKLGEFWCRDIDVIGWQIGRLDLFPESQCNFDNESGNSF